MESTPKELNTREGEVMGVVQFPRPWPVGEARRVMEMSQATTRVEFHANTDGSLTFVVADLTVRREYRAQPLDVKGKGFAILNASWSADNIVMRINNEPLLSHVEASGSARVVRTSDSAIGVTPSWDDGEAASACAQWVDWRRERFGVAQTSPGAGRRLKSQGEQVQELFRASRILADLTVLIQRGHSHFLGHLAAELRALVFWNNRQTHNPLLLRLAGRGRLALPVYTFPDKGPLPSPTPLFHVIGDRPSIVKTHSTQVIADVQNWLNSTALSEGDEGKRGGLRHLSVLNTIAGVADSLGAAHYDEDMPSAVETLGRFRGPVGDQVTTVLLVAASVVIPLCQYVGSRLPAGRAEPS